MQFLYIYIQIPKSFNHNYIEDGVNYMLYREWSFTAYMYVSKRKRRIAIKV